MCSSLARVQANLYRLSLLDSRSERLPPLQLLDERVPIESDGVHTDYESQKEVVCLIGGDIRDSYSILLFCYLRKKFTVS